MSDLGRRKYLERYAEPESRFAQELGHRYAAALIVPLVGESIGFLDGIASAAAHAPGRVLVIGVVNATDAAPPHVHRENEQLLRELNERMLFPRQELAALDGSPALAVLGRPGAYDLLVIDRASPARRLPTGEGVGLARRIAMDVALGIHELGNLGSPWLSSTDADAQLPDDYFQSLAMVGAETADGRRRVALTLPFQHVPGGDPAVDTATALYELSLRYYTLGLAAAGSPYAYESLGSSLAVLASAYAEVRGFPRRQAAEDFYLLDKLAKVGAIHRPACAPILLRSRTSERVPFGTGARVQELLESREELRVYHPRTFELLGVALRALHHAVVTRVNGEDDALSELRRLLDAGTAGAVCTALEELRAFEALREMLGASPDARVRERRFFTWFDALRTLRFIHLIEAPAALPRLPLFEAFASAPFCNFWRPGPAGPGRPAASTSTERLATERLKACRTAFFEAEAALPPDIGAGSAFLAGVNGS
jgi:hypothetical protein